jgi:hypothetical protein
MGRIAVAAVGIEAKDLTVLKSLLNLVTGSQSVPWHFVDDPAQAHLSFLGNLPRDQVEALASAPDRRGLLVYCCQRGESAPAGVVSAHCPPRANELAQLFAEAVRLADGASGATSTVTATPAEVAAAPPAAAPVAVPAAEILEPERILAGAIHALMPRLLIDQPLLVTVAEAPPLLLDVHAGVRTAHADPAWFASPDFWRVEASAWKLSTAPDPARWAECRRHPARPYPALRFWGVVSGSRGRPKKEVAKAAEIGLKKLPDFKALPHWAWHPAMAAAMTEKKAPLAAWASLVGHPVAEVIDFVNGCAALGLLK